MSNYLLKYVTFPTIGNIIAILLFSQAIIVCACMHKRERRYIHMELWSKYWNPS